MPRILLFLAWPLAEIGLFVIIGGEIGLWPTLAWVVLTALVGIVILRFEAARGAGLIRSGLSGTAISQGGAIGDPIRGLMRALAGVLLVLPGFLTDALGILLLLPPVQALMRNLVTAKLGTLNARGFAAGQSPFGAPRAGSTNDGRDDSTIDGEWIELPPEANRNRPSRWTEPE
ncbi:FxsA family protein [Xinfangfangia sp. D13-10-4-6]|uniref:FxsA family protein n=1 Tax=Pseudogemmobacter hezensis TaxID=2737662 RepID=UPI001553673D|nr:FxsA family protein [Pseudogemmobacter hezensis]NPD14295.1 FxsA family protein [Pseudogemmobacter hezensis]